MEQEGKMGDKRFTTDEIVATVMKWRAWDVDSVDQPIYRWLIAKLRAADKLCEAAKKLLEVQNAIADYEKEGE